MRRVSRKLLIFIAICLFSLLGVRLIMGAAPTGGVAYWNFNEGTGTTVADSWGTNTGTLTGTTWVAGKYGNALSFNGTSSYVSIGKTDIAAPWTAAMWVNRTDSTATSSALMGSASGALKLEQYNNTNQVGFTKYGTGDYTFNYTAPTGTWVHLTFVGTSTGVSLYVNGVFQASNSGVVSCPMSYIGCGKSGLDYLNGSLDDVKVYNRALSAQEILDLYNNVTPTPTPTSSTAPTPTPTNTPSATSVPTGNLALNKPATASSVESGTSFTANLAVDGNTGTRWSSAYSDPQWIYVDLGQTYNIQSVRLTWETAYAKTYKIQVSSDAANWTDVYSTTAGAGGTEFFGVTPTNGRYVRMYGTQRATTYGYSLWEFEVYSTPLPPPIPAIIPRPVSFTSGTGNFTLTSGTVIYVNGNNSTETTEIYNNSGLYLANKLKPATGYTFSVVQGSTPPSNSIYLNTAGGDSTLGNEGYTINITTTGVTISAYKPEGLFRAIQTLRQMLPADIEKSSLVTGVAWVIPCATIRDYPAYSWRGYMLDVARHFFSVTDVKRQIDLMAEYKINRFHMHLTDDQGWRLDIHSWPNLSIIGGASDYSGGAGGYYTQAQFTDIVNYAQARYITLVPEIDMPGHCSAAIKAYSQLGSSGQLYPRQESTYTFISNVISELAPLTPGAYIHIGGDESSISASDYDYFIGRVNDIVASYGKKMIGWNPVDTTSGIHTDSLLQHWSGSYSSAQSKGIQIIFSPADKIYLDMKYDTSNTFGQTWAGYVPTNTAYSWDPTNYVSQSQSMGVEGPLWSEYIDAVSKIDFMTYPRLPGLAEIGWTPVSMRSWSEYKLRLKAHGPRMTNLGINFYHDPVVPW